MNNFTYRESNDPENIKYSNHKNQSKQLALKENTNHYEIIIDAHRNFLF